MMNVISGKTQKQEVTPKWWSFDLVKWIRAHRQSIFWGWTSRNKPYLKYIRWGERVTYWWTRQKRAKPWRELMTYALNKGYWRTGSGQRGNQGWLWKWMVFTLWKVQLRWEGDVPRVVIYEMWNEWMGEKKCQVERTTNNENHQSVVISSTTSPHIHVVWSVPGG